MRTLFEANINVQQTGAVVAAPDVETPGGSYYYHWMRDGALTMRSVLETTPDFSHAQALLESYTKWVLGRQSATAVNGIDVRIEPKFMIPNGEVFTGAWCRPQNDGPGLRATSLVLFANELLKRGDKDFVLANLWTGSDGVQKGGAIKHDLDWVVNGWSTSTCDLWEEVQSTDFFWNRVTMKKAMLIGSTFAQSMGDSASAATYAATAKSIDTALAVHWTGTFVTESSNRQRDGAVFVGFNDGFHASDGRYAPTSVEVASTMNVLNTAFCSEYSINTKDTAAGVPGVLIGRYPGDKYAGGNPWVLTTAALGQLLYRAASYTLSHGLPSSEALEQFGAALNVEFPQTAEAAAEVFAAAGDSVMLRLRKHVGADGGHLAEQMDRNTGAQMSAEDLTWSYAEVLNAMHQREVYFETKR